MTPCGNIRILYGLTQLRTGDWNQFFVQCGLRHGHRGPCAEGRVLNRDMAETGHLSSGITVNIAVFSAWRPK